MCVREREKRFHSLSLLNWGRRKNPTVKAIKREEGGGEQREHWPSAQSIIASLPAGRAWWPGVEPSKGQLFTAPVGVRV